MLLGKAPLVAVPEDEGIKPLDDDVADDFQAQLREVISKES